MLPLGIHIEPSLINFYVFIVFSYFTVALINNSNTCSFLAKHITFSAKATLLLLFFNQLILIAFYYTNSF
ncbi:hypothetical protein B9G39_17620 [Zooshikella ganghwensis]|uniref:Uncharacterized protein n=1 Tax=Zooshikella ganghwensis TaxID=202772 RepID=A0A4P9VNS1_9GAMM|nr:hypothetical protein B9G39_17620 [Zooshikella ganghwensis]